MRFHCYNTTCLNHRAGECLECKEHAANPDKKKECPALLPEGLYFCNIQCKDKEWDRGIKAHREKYGRRNKKNLSIKEMQNRLLEIAREKTAKKYGAVKNQQKLI